MLGRRNTQETVRGQYDYGSVGFIDSINNWQFYFHIDTVSSRFGLRPFGSSLTTSNCFLTNCLRDDVKKIGIGFTY